MDEGTWTAFLTSLGASAPTRSLIVDTGGWTSLATFLEVEVPEFDTVWEEMRNQASRMREQNANQRPNLSYPLKRTLYAFRVFCEYYIASNITLDILIVDWETMDAELKDDWFKHVQKMKEAEKEGSDSFTELPNLHNLKDWHSFKELLKTRLRQERNTCHGCPLIYLLRDYEESTEEILGANYDDLDDYIATCLDFPNSENFLRDNKKLYQLIKPKVIDGDLWSFIQAFDDKQDGRAAYFAIYNQAEGPAAKKERVRQAHRDMQSLHYTGRNRNFPFSKYVTRHQQCHNILEEKDNDEQVTETMKIEHFLNGISDPLLETSKAAVRASESQYDTFSKVQIFMTSQHDIIKKKPEDPNFRVAVMQTNNTGKKRNAEDNGQGSSKKGKKEPPKKKNKKSTFIPNKKWREMQKNGQAAAIIAQRKAEKEKRNASAVKTAPVKNPKPDAKPASPPINELQAGIAKQISFGKTQGKFVVQGQEVNFSVGAVAASKASVKPQEELEKGTQEEYEASSKKSASSQFGRAGRKRIQAELVSKYPSAMDVDDPIPRKGKSVADEFQEATISALMAKIGEGSYSKATLKADEDDLVDTDDEEEWTEPTTAASKSLSTYKAPKKGNSYEEELIRAPKVTVQELCDNQGLDITQFKQVTDPESDGEDEDDEESTPLVSLLIPRKYLMQEFPGQYLLPGSKLEKEALAKATSVSKQKDLPQWQKSVGDYVTPRVQFREYCSKYKGQKVFQIKDPVHRISIQAARYQILRQEYQTYKSFETEEDRKEYRELVRVREALIKGASSTGDPKAAAYLAAWNEAEGGSGDLSAVKNAFYQAMVRVKRALKEAEEADDLGSDSE